MQILCQLIRRLNQSAVKSCVFDLLSSFFCSTFFFSFFIALFIIDCQVKRLSRVYRRAYACTCFAHLLYVDLYSSFGYRTRERTRNRIYTAHYNAWMVPRVYTRVHATHTRDRTRHARTKDEAVSNLSFVSTTRKNCERDCTNELLYIRIVRGK